MSEHLTITLPHPAKALRPNGRAHWAAKAAAVKKERRLAMLETLGRMSERPAWSMTHCPQAYTVRWYYWLGVAPDADNALASCKAYLDGCCDALQINDRLLLCRGIERVKDRATRVEIVFHYYNDEQED